MMKIEDMFRDRFSIIAAGPGGVDRLRELILELAVHLAAKSDSPSIKYVPLGECGEWLGGLTPSKQRAAYWDDESIPWFSPKDMKRVELDDAQDHITPRALEETSLKLLPPGSVLFVVRGMILAHTFPVAVTTRPATINQDMRAIIPKAEIYDRYLVTVLRGCERKILALVKTSTHGTKKLDSPELKQWIIPVPPLDEQHRIVKKVDHLMALCDDLEARQRAERDERRRLRTASLATLEDAATAEEAERAWAHVAGEFGRLVDRIEDVAELRTLVLELSVKGKFIPRYESGERRDPNIPITTSGSDRGALITVSIPEGWSSIYFRDVIINMRNGIYKPASSYSENGAGCLRMYNINAGKINFEKMKRMNLTDEEIQQYSLDHGDLLVNRVNSRELVGKAATIPVLKEPLVYESKNIRVRLNQELIVPDYANMLFQIKNSRKFFQGDAKQTCGQASISQPQIESLQILLPPLSDQLHTVEQYDRLTVFCDTLEAAIRARDAALEAFAAAACRTVLGGPAPASDPAAVSVKATGQQRLQV